MADDEELTSEEVFALADAFPTAGSARTLLQIARFPPAAIPQSGFSNSREFWSLVAEQVSAGVKAGMRKEILRAAKQWLPANAKFARFAAAADQGQYSRPAGPAGTVTVSVSDARGVQIGDGNYQVNNFGDGPGGGRAGGTAAAFASQGTPPAGGRTDELRVLVIGASPIDQDLPHVRADREGRAIEKSAIPGRLVVKVVSGAEATDVRHVGSFRPDIVHFVCHGTDDSLVFNDERGEAHYVAASRVAEGFRFYRDEHGVRLRGIVLAACDGERLAPCFADVAGTVIAHRGKLADQCGVAFAGQFYSQLNQVPAARLDDAGLAALAREAAQLTAQYSPACDAVVTNLILLPDGR